MDSKAYWVALQQAPGIGAIRAKCLLEFFPDILTLWSAPARDIGKVPQISQEMAGKFVKFRDAFPVADFYKQVKASGCWVITPEDEGYPPLLKEIYDPPLVLYGLGRRELLHNQIIAVVGCRKPSYYGQQMARNICGELAANQFTIASGMAKGIDTCAHLGCLEQMGNTIAVLGSGIDVVYPPENKKLYQELREKGTIVSEYPPRTKPVQGNFPARNRIISGIALGVVVIEAGKKSGALITADLAMEQGRDVFALPGLVTNPNAVGTHGLIKQGAKLIETAADVIEEYFPDRLFYPVFGNSKNNGQQNILPEIDQSLLVLLKSQPLHIEEICVLTNKPVMEINAALLRMEIKGVVKQLPGNIFCLTFD